MEENCPTDNEEIETSDNCGLNSSENHDVDILDKYQVVMNENYYTPPVEVEPGDLAAMLKLDTDKLIELREVLFLLIK